MDESGYFTEAAGPELQKKNVLEEGNEAGEYLMFSHFLLYYQLHSCRFLRVPMNIQSYALNMDETQALLIMCQLWK